MITVSDTTPLRYLIEIEEAHILEILFGKVVIPEKHVRLFQAVAAIALPMVLLSASTLPNSKSVTAFLKELATAPVPNTLNDLLR